MYLDENIQVFLDDFIAYEKKRDLSQATIKMFVKTSYHWN
jgi:hypothetical protein